MYTYKPRFEELSDCLRVGDEALSVQPFFFPQRDPETVRQKMDDTLKEKKYRIHADRQDNLCFVVLSRL